MPKISLQAGRAFDAGMAAFAALSAGFVAFAMPDALFTSLVEASRLPDFVAAAQPPLGDTARFATVGAAALFTFAAVWALMAALDRSPARRADAPEPEAEAPRLRRADAHPDAPARRPLLARDLGEPLELNEVAADPVESPAAADGELRPLPAFLIPQEQDPEPEFVAEAAEPDAGPEPVTDAQPEPEAEAEPIAALAARLPEAEPATDQSLSQLVNRIEFGLSRKRQALPAAELPPAEEPPAGQERVGHRLRGAINDLQKLASGGA
jgi:hypothetical protein